MISKSQLLVTWAGLLISAWPLDMVVESFVQRLPPKSLLRATDTVVHGLIGGFSYLMACIICPDLVLHIFRCLPFLRFGSGTNKHEALDTLFSFCVAFMISCCVDLDHIIMDVMQIKRMPFQRGWFHLSLFPLGLTIIFYLSALPFHSQYCVISATLSILCILSHHIRDGVHHGLDFYPFGTTPVLPYWLYIILTLTLPISSSYLSSSLIRQLKPSLDSLTQSSMHMV
ncbi:transmembrane protein 267-like [Portunus trituberculatus]|uniref:Transmembrane protein 267 n=1 Tax=Portunus trituberculatus TaxID=210409 RepID=A0A5B7CQD4_PORTR|nr:transmembrane protein 267-like [Portunus trituberculatus]XP_045102758.1 transmembrane protein 267-like [Portunus trituberculatus]XP_045102759.1 transmembrane protein 267-like [Portunus trituberculatus]MPC11021.1 Transmembrane protein C5orf28 [Portunus trituberculatus]